MVQNMKFLHNNYPKVISGPQSNDLWILTHLCNIVSNTSLHIHQKPLGFSKSVIFLLNYETFGRKAIQNHLLKKSYFGGHSSWVKVNETKGELL